MLFTSCDVNAFDAPEPCLSESFLTNPDGGAVAFFGSSRYGFGNPDLNVSLGPSFQYNVRFLKHLFASDTDTNMNSFASIAAMTKTDFVLNGSTGGTFLYLLYALNAMGDPELPIFTGDPSSFDNVKIYRMGNGLTVNTGGIRDCRICITSEDLAAGYHRAVEGVSFFMFEEVPERFQVTITAPNFYPYLYKSSAVTRNENRLKSRVRFYPNPASDHLFFDTDFPQVRIELFDMQGKLLMELAGYPGSGIINLSAYPDGAYILKFQSDADTAWFRFLKRS
jgi:hypothetical protein